MFCDHCGAQLREDAVFCHVCGSRQLPEAQDSTAALPAPAAQAPSVPEAMKPEKTAPEQQAEEPEQQQTEPEQQPAEPEKTAPEQQAAEPEKAAPEQQGPFEGSPVRPLSGTFSWENVKISGEFKDGAGTLTITFS